MKKTISLDLRERIVANCYKGEETQQETADRYNVSLGMVKKLLGQLKRHGTIANLHHRAGRKPYFTEEIRTQIKSLIEKRNDITLEKIREELQLKCSLSSVYNVLRDMGFTFKKNATRERTKARRCC